MNSYGHVWRRGLRDGGWVLLVLTVLLQQAPLLAQQADSDDAREKAIVDRFVTVLEKNPRRGTALDKVYGFHVERGSLNGLIKMRTRCHPLLERRPNGHLWL